MNRPVRLARGAGFFVALLIGIVLCLPSIQAQTLPLRWNRAPVTYAVAVLDRKPTPAQRQALSDAAAAWQTALPEGYRLTASADAETADIEVLFLSASALAHLPALSWDGPSPFVRVTVRPATGNPPGIAHAVVWVRNDLTPALTRALIAHGIGHALGVGHGEKADLMRPDPATFALSLPAGGLLSGRDTSALWALYGHG